MDELRRFVELTKERRELKAHVDRIDEELKEIEPRLLDEFAKQGMRNCSVDGMTVYLHRQVWATAEDGDQERAVAALKAAGMDEYVRESFNVNSLSAWVREHVRETENGLEDLPEEFAGAINVEERTSLRARRS